MQKKLERIDLISDLLVLGVRQKLLGELIPLSGKISVLLGGVIKAEDCLFPIKSKKSYSCCGWIKFKMGALVANELFRIYSNMYSFNDVITKPISPEKLVQVTLAFNLKYGNVYSIDINQVYSLFVAISKRLVYPSKCHCGARFLRSDHPNNLLCPECRIDKKSTPLFKPLNSGHKQSFDLLHIYAQEESPDLQ